eukprot:6185304-Pleurochrysis_carterae.AAC.1
MKWELGQAERQAKEQDAWVKAVGGEGSVSSLQERRQLESAIKIGVGEQKDQRLCICGHLRVVENQMGRTQREIKQGSQAGNWETDGEMRMRIVAWNGIEQG